MSPSGLRSWRILPVHPKAPPSRSSVPLNQCLTRVDASFQGFNFNTAVAAFMEFLNVATRHGLNRGQADRFVRALSPFAPHFAEEIWERLGNQASIAFAAWPEVDDRYLEADDFEMPVQIMGKLRGKAIVPRESLQGRDGEGGARRRRRQARGQDDRQDDRRPRQTRELRREVTSCRLGWEGAPVGATC